MCYDEKHLNGEGMRILINAAIFTFTGLFPAVNLGNRRQQQSWNNRRGGGGNNGGYRSYRGNGSRGPKVLNQQQDEDSDEEI